MLKTLIEIWKDRSGGPAIAALGPIFSVVSSAVSIIGGISSLFGGKKDKVTPTVVAEAQKVTGAPQSEAQTRQATDRARRRRASSVGRKDTILTSPLGLSDDGDVARTSLLGQ